jgi:hypothetical protein
VYVGGSELRAVDAISGRLDFSTHVSRPGLAGALENPVVADGAVFTQVGVQNSGFLLRNFAVDSASGRILWSSGPHYFSTPACVTGNQVTIAYEDPTAGTVSYSARTGGVRWRLPGSAGNSTQWMSDGTRLFGFMRLAGVPVRAQARAYTLSGARLWTQQGFLPEAVAYGRVYGILMTGSLRSLMMGVPAAVSAATGRLLWRDSGAEYVRAGLNSAVVANGTLYESGYNGSTIFAFDVASGRLIARISLPAGFSQPANLRVASGLLILNAEVLRGGYLYPEILAFGR